MYRNKGNPEESPIMRVTINGNQRERILRREPSANIKMIKTMAATTRSRENPILIRFARSC